MASIRLGCDEVLALLESQGPRHKALRRLWCREGVIHAELDPGSVLPGILQRALPSVSVRLSYQDFQGGVARFQLGAELLGLSADALVKLLLKLFPLQKQRGVALELYPTPAGRVPFLTVDLQRLIDERMGGVVLERFTLQGDELRFYVALRAPFKLKRDKEDAGA